MTSVSKALAALTATVLLSSCAGMKLQDAQHITPSGSDFSTSLYKGYVDISQAEYREADYRDSDVFAERAIRAGMGEAVEPEAISGRRLPEEKVGELSAARERLSAAFAGGAATRMPGEAAHAQVMFDCWMQEQEENLQPDDIARCRGEFMDAMAKLEVEPQTAAAPAPLPGPYVVFFDFDKAELSDGAKAVLAKVVSEAGSLGAAKIVASGHADRAGANSYNDALSNARVEAVLRYLVESGVEKGKVLSSSHGEAKPAIMTEDGKAEARNRRVEITFTR